MAAVQEVYKVYARYHGTHKGRGCSLRCGIRDGRVVKLWVNCEGLEELPEEIGVLTELEDLRVCSKRLRSLPSSVSGLRKLTHLKLAVTTPGVLVRSNWFLDSLIFLDLTFREGRVIPSWIFKFKGLEHLGLHGPFRHVPLDICGLRNLRSLDLSGSEVSVLPPYLLFMSQLEVLDLRTNSLSALPEYIDMLWSLRVLDMGHNMLRKLPDAVGNIQGLEVLRVDDTRLKDIPSSIGGLRNLRVLDLSNTMMSAFPECVTGLSSLQELSLYGKAIFEVPESIGEMSSLECLNLGVTGIRRVPESIGRLQKLRELTLAFNPIEQLPASMVNLKNLELLDVRCTQLVKRPDLGADLPKLREVRWNHGY